VTRKGITLALKGLLTAAFVVAGIIFVVNQGDEFRQLQWPSALPVLFVAGGFIASVALRSLYNWLVARRLGSGVTASESFLISSVATAANLVFPVGAGVGLRAIYMKRVHGFPISHFAGSTIVFAVLNVLAVSTFALAILFLLPDVTGKNVRDLLALFLAPVVVAVAIAAAGRWRRDALPDDATDWLGRFRQGLLLVMRDRNLMVVSMAIVAANLLLACVVWTVALRDYLPETRLAEAFLIAASQVISGFISLTPGAVGFQELIGVYVGRSLDTLVVQLFAVLVWVRAVRMIAAIALAAPAALMLRKSKLRWSPPGAHS